MELNQRKTRFVDLSYVRKKEISLRKFFMHYFVHLFLSLLAVSALWFLFFVIIYSSGSVIPANTIEQTVSDWQKDLSPDTELTPDMIPVGADYAFFTLDGSLTDTSLTGSSLEEAQRLAVSGQTSSYNPPFNRVYQKFVTDSQTAVITYPLHSTFTNDFLYHIFPVADVFFLLLLLLMLVADVVLVSFAHARQLEKELLPLQYTSEQIRAQNLDFPLPRTRFREYNHILESLGAMKEELQHSLKKQWQLEQLKKKQMSALAHDIKTPLTLVKGNAELLAESSLDPEQRACIDYILANTERIQNYVIEIIEVSKDAYLPGSDTCIPLSGLLSQLERNVTMLGQDKELSFVLDAEDVSPDILVPGDAASRSLWNLLDNAVWYSPKHGTITLRIRTQVASVPSPNDTPPQAASDAKRPVTAFPLLLFEVADEGPGFSPEALRYAATEFYRADESRGSDGHFGMGLAITKRIVSELGGTLQFANRPEVGAIVSVTIPANEGLPHPRWNPSEHADGSIF